MMDHQLDDAEREQGELIKGFRKHLPPPTELSARDRTFVVSHIEKNPQLKQFVHKGLQRFLANSASLPDGRTLCVIEGQPGTKRFEFFPLVWGSPFGACLRLLLSTRRKAQAVFAVGDPDHIETLQEGKIVFAFYRLGRLVDLKCFDIASSTEANSRFRQLISMCKSTHREIIGADKYIVDASLVRAHSCSEKYFGDDWGRLEWLQLGWLDECQSRSSHAIKRLCDHPSVEAAQNHPLFQDFPLLCRTTSELLVVRSYKHETLRALIELYKSAAIVDLVLELTVASDQISSHESIDADTAAALKEVSSLGFDIWNLLELDAEMSSWGTNQISWRSLALGDKSAVGGEQISLNPDGFSIPADNAARFYWVYKRPAIPTNRSAILSVDDFPIAPKKFVEGFSSWRPELDEAAAEDSIRSLLNEAVAMKEWTIPPNAFVELPLGPFSGVEVTEIRDDVYFVWRTPDNLYLDMSVGVDTQTFANTEIFNEDPDEPFNRRGQLAMQLLMSSIIRDFWVVTERQRLFELKRSRARAQSIETDRRRVVYLPRVRYLGAKFNLRQLTDSLEYRARSQHYVKPFFRKVQPSALQLEIARRAGIIVPAEHTYVRGHYRGLDRSHGQKVYRSRSALALLFEHSREESLEYQERTLTDWFVFEEAVSVLLEKSFGCRIEHRATRGKTDYGIDILATKQSGDIQEIWVVQCKCYRPSNLIGPNHIRELLGAIADMNKDEQTPVRGMLVTTSGFSGDALRLALKHGIHCVSGKDLAAIFDSLNKGSRSSPLH
jgi:hypothetical protein